MDDATGSTLISDISAKVPDIQTLYDSHPSNIVRADLLRYILLWYYGGFYADMDVFPAREIKECPALEPFFDETSKTPDVSLVVGIEIDEPRASPRLMKNWRWARNHGFIQYAIYAPRPFSPILREAIIRVLSHNRHHTKTSFFRPQYNERTILDISGPGMFTDVTLDVLSQTLPSSHQLIDSSVEADEDIGDLRSASGVVRRVTWAPFHKIRDPLCVAGSEAVAGSRMGGLCVLPVSVWGNGQRHSGAEGFSGEHACLNHRFKGTWKKKGWRGTFGN